MSFVATTKPNVDRIVILGAGPCGLACADALERLGHHQWVVLEAAETVGGLASSVVDDAGFTWDLGGHVVFSHFGEFDRLLAELFTSDALLRHDRSSFIRFGDRWVPYLFQQHLDALPLLDAMACLLGLAAARIRRGHLLVPAATDFASWLRSTYGTATVGRFFAPYNTKVWAVPLEEMGMGWVSERVAPSARGSALRGAPPRASWGPNSTFAFPRRGGTGEIWRRLAARLGGGVRTGCRVAAVDPRTHCVVLADGEVVGYDRLVSTMPLDQLTAMTDTAPPRVRRAAAGLRHNTVAMVGLGYRTPTRDPRSWLYFPQSDVPFHRATNFGKYAPANVPGGDTETFSAWMTETSMAPGIEFDSRALTRSCDESLRRHGLVAEHTPLISAHVEVIPYAYPIPTLERDRILSTVVPWLESHHIYPRGRFGTWRYELGNMDHAVKMGIDIAKRLVTGAAEEIGPVPAGYSTMTRRSS